MRAVYLDARKKVINSSKSRSSKTRNARGKMKKRIATMGLKLGIENG